VWGITPDHFKAQFAISKFDRYIDRSESENLMIFQHHQKAKQKIPIFSIP
jgi:hypothetical protein